MAELIKAAGYIRMSSDSQDSSPEQQREQIAEYAKSKGYEVGVWYEDLGISGDATDKRVGFQRMVADGAAGSFKVILCWDQDRFGRFDSIEAGHWIYPLRRAGVTLDTVTKGRTDWNDMSGRMIYSITQEGKHAYLRDLARNVKRGHDKSVKQGKWTTGFAPFGYAVDPETRKLIPASPEEVRTLRQMFERYAAGDSYRQLVAWLNVKGVKTRRGNAWQPRSVAHALSNERYRGHLFYGQTSKSKYLDDSPPGGKAVSNPREKWIVLRNTHEPLISQELWEAVQRQRGANATKTGPNSKNQYPLTGMLYCGNCGGRMGGGNHRGTARYLCLTYQAAKAGCERRTVRQDDVLPQVLRQLRVQFFDRYFGEQERGRLKAEMRRILLAGHDDEKRRVAADKTRLAELDAELEQSTSAYIQASETMKPLVEKRVREVQDERDAVADRLQSRTAPAAEQIRRAEERIDAAIGWLDRLEELVAGEYDPVAVQRMLRQYIDRIEVDTERIPEGTAGKRHTVKLTGGRIYFQTEKFPVWLIPDEQTCSDLSGRFHADRRGQSVSLRVPGGCAQDMQLHAAASGKICQ